MQCFHKAMKVEIIAVKLFFCNSSLHWKPTKSFFYQFRLIFVIFKKPKTDLFVLSIKHFLIFKNFNYHINFYLLFQFSCLRNRLKRLKLRGWYIYIYSSYYFENVFLECGYIKWYLFQLHCLLI